MVFVYHSFTTRFKFLDFYCGSQMSQECHDKTKGFLFGFMA